MTPDLSLPTSHSPVGTYVMAVRTGSLLFVSGHGFAVEIEAVIEVRD